MTIKLIVGLGNFGCRYLETRHNSGARYVEFLAKKYKVSLNKKNILSGYVGVLNLDIGIVYLLIPAMYMNINGLSVYRCIKFYKLCVDQVLVAYDELDLLPGVVRVKLGSRANSDTHHGVKDLVLRLNRKCNFYRLRIGIGHPGNKNKVCDFVLNKPSINDRISIDNAINKAIACTEDIVARNFIKVMNILHR
ncbi:aminoacyl-tRNA hydrolase [Candidatus Blochmannia ocreatus (nom. nud.)]|uniref:Peptidyl-tRNA hydrolase n=1 Tax=Candidatus Blochmannia ocreatus (nom. nud.) TaxID=251538 RepID=A0ABY4SWQ7_9ENTR|nr:aminoacyl-tRNA hydrolase [Candidatus Blochmannia ocreatus]URJ25405.1 aminoacyl-tRNA hydrolase [Candidatus Blochmannia ocreatus]